MSIFPSFSNLFILLNVWVAPLNSFLLCIRVILLLLESSSAQSKAESPPPKMHIFLSLNKFLLVTE